MPEEHEEGVRYHHVPQNCPLGESGRPYHTVTVEITGSNPVRIAMSKRYSESSNQDLKNDSAESLRREWNFMGKQEQDTPPPSSVGTFHEGCLTGFVEIENRNNYSSVISRWGNFGRCPNGRGHCLENSWV